jgi:hypothetical protein
LQKGVLSERSRHAATFFGALLAGVGAALAVVGVVLSALGAACFADLCAKAAKVVHEP